MLADIKPIEPMYDLSFYLFLIVSVLVIAAITAAVFFFRGLRNPKKKVIRQLESLDLTRSKKAAYTITAQAGRLIEDEQMRARYEQLVFDLEPYKYKKEVPAMDERVKKEFDLFLELARARV